MDSKGYAPIAVSLIVPCLNEEENLPILIGRLAKMELQGWEVIVVDDGSSDRTVAVTRILATQYDFIRLRRHPRNLGLGAAMRTGFMASSGSIICTMGCNCTIAPERLPDLIRMVQAGEDVARVCAPQTVPGKILSYFALRGDIRFYRSIRGAYRRDIFLKVVNELPSKLDRPSKIGWKASQPRP